jgi:hypothetical protein
MQVGTAQAPSHLQALGCFQQASALPLPSTATPAAMAQNFVPLFGAIVGKVA